MLRVLKEGEFLDHLQLFQILSGDELLSATHEYLSSKSSVDKRSERPKDSSDASVQAICGTVKLNAQFLERDGVDCVQAFQPLACQHCLLIGCQNDVDVVAASCRNAKISRRGV